MSANSASIPPSPNTNLGTSSLSSDPSTLPLWDRLTTWASENKAAVYTIAGVAVVLSGAGVAYYLSDSRKSSAAAADKKRPSKKERRRAKQEKDKVASQSEVKAPPEQPKESKMGSLCYCHVACSLSCQRNLERQKWNQIHWRVSRR